jgi:hypothetical protein
MRGLEKEGYPRSGRLEKIAAGASWSVFSLAPIPAIAGSRASLLLGLGLEALFEHGLT